MVVALLHIGISSGEKLLEVLGTKGPTAIDIPLVMSDRRNGWDSPTFASA
jgi:hypothetical protein